MHHLDEVAGAVRPAVQIALLGRALDLFTSRRARDIAASWRQRGENRIEMLHHVGVAADHHAIAAFQPPDSAAGADVDITDALDGQFFGAADIVDVIGVAAVDDDVAALEMGEQIGNDAVDRRGRHHEPNRARLGQGLGEVLYRSGADGLLFNQFRYRLCRPVVDHALMTAP